MTQPRLSLSNDEDGKYLGKADFFIPKPFRLHVDQDPDDEEK